MMRIRLLCASSCILMIGIGCVVPDSAVGYLAVSGSFEALVLELPEQIDLLLPKQYGLGGLDHVIGEPEEYGNKDVMLSADISEGSFSVEFPPVVYHTSFWLLPPLGPYPRHPPAPAYYLRFSNNLNEVYIVGFQDEQFEYRVFDNASQTKIPKEEATWKIIAGEFIAVETDANEDQMAHEVWHLRVRIENSK